jgi:hypothetical protein
MRMSMRVNYTLPALDIGSIADLPATPESVPAFREQLRASTVFVPTGWEHRLGLDERPFTATYIGPPPRPHTLQLYDAPTERSRWRNMLWQHGSTLPSRQTFVSNAGRQAVQQMLAMFLEMQEAEDSIVSQNVAVTRG